MHVINVHQCKSIKRKIKKKMSKQFLDIDNDIFNIVRWRQGMITYDIVRERRDPKLQKS